MSAFFLVYLKKSINNEAEYVKAVSLMVEVFFHMEGPKQEIIKSGLVLEWEKSLDYCINNTKLKGKDVNVGGEEVRILYGDLMY